MAKEESNYKTYAKKALKLYAIAWFVVYTIGCTPHRWTSKERVVKETIWRFLYPFAVQIMPYASVNGFLPTLDPHKLLPIEPKPAYIEIDNSVPLERAYETLYNAYVKQDAIVVWKNFTAGSLDGWSDEKYVEEHVNMNAEYTFARNFSNFLTSTLPLEKAWHDLENLYLGFSYDFLNDNPELYTGLKKAVSAKGEKLSNLIPYDWSFHHAFLYKGKKYSTGMHQAPASDWFFQLGNAKTWRFIHPRYTPYIRPVTSDSISLNSYYDYLPDDSPIPYIDVTTETGDMMFFPCHWWHQVTNLEDGLGIGIGFRPIDDAIIALKQGFFPWTLNNKALTPHRSGFTIGGIRRAVDAIVGTINTLSTGSGLDQRKTVLCNLTRNMQKYNPGWTWNKRTGFATLLCEDVPQHLEEWETEL